MNPDASDRGTANSRASDPTTRAAAPNRRRRPSIAIVGGGISGLTAARSLSGEGFAVEVFDKGRGAGGRASTRREGSHRFDHGAQYFTVKDERFKQEVDRWISEGCAAEWCGRIAFLEAGGVIWKESLVHRFVGVPGMNAIVKRLAQNAKVHFGVRVSAVERDGQRWSLFDDSGKLATVDIILLALPPEQAVQLLQSISSPLAHQVRPIQSEPCWAVLASFKNPLPVEFDGVFVESCPIAWAARDSSKPGRGPGERWVLHATPEWSAHHIEGNTSEVAETLIRSFFTAAGSTPVSPEFVAAHRWRFAKVQEPLTEGSFWDSEWALGVCGDWCHGCRVEGAFLSGLAMAERVISNLDQPKHSTP